MRKDGAPAARFGFSSDGSSGVGSQNHEANCVECVKWPARTPVVATILRTVPFWGSFDGPQPRGYNENDIPNDLLRRWRSDFCFQAEDGIRDGTVTGVQTCALPICLLPRPSTMALPAAHPWRVPPITPVP